MHWPTEILMPAGWVLANAPARAAVSNPDAAVRLGSAAIISRLRLESHKCGRGLTYGIFGGVEMCCLLVERSKPLRTLKLPVWLTGCHAA